MTSLKRIKANQKNALRSTGPRSVSGKLASARNAVKLGLFGREVLLADEDRSELKQMSRKVLADLQPVGEVERTLAELIIASLWRWKRIHRIESDLFAMYRVYQGRDGGVATGWAQDASNTDSFSRLSRYETTLERRVLRLLHELQRLQATRRGNMPSAPMAIDIDVQTDS